MELSTQLLQDQGKEGCLGFAATVCAPAAQELGVAQAVQLPACAGGRMGVGDALGREVGVSYHSRTVRVGELGEMGKGPPP